ncbi:MAG: hypothetical protein CVT49_08355 [candidate division Zixibacteria bacterium HGW-Zixibacteria-1]|nr:MAG: hypothetical protein CVT49_08355 [candidate division Zixibacteria bacterium HGW-Zixibacteria-1]
MKKHFTLLIPLLVLSFLISGCYTKIAQPGDEGSYLERNDTSADDNYGNTHYYYPSYWTLYGNWGHYYAQPWWYDYYDGGHYYDDDNGGESPRPEVPGQATRPGSRWQPTGLDGANQISTGSSAGSTGGTTSGKQTSPETKDKPETKKKEEPSKNDDSKEETNQPKGRWQTK